MKTVMLVSLLVLLGLTLPLSAADKPFAAPILLTSCGQSADVLMVKALLSRDSMDYTYLAGAAASDLAGKGSLMLVLGGSSKGLGAAKISAEDETKRITALVAAAQKSGIPVLAVHLGGMNRRGALSDPFNQIGAEAAAKIVVVKGGNDDGFFTKIAADKKVALVTVDTAMKLSDELKALYKPAK